MAGDKCDSNWVYGGIFPQNEDEKGFAIIYQQEPEIKKYPVYADTVGQYIGFPDKNEKEIYEYDIVRIHQFLFDGVEYEKEIIVSIEYMEEMACFGANLLQAEEIKRYMGHEEDSDKVVIPICELHGLHEESFEVIGNIFDNKELLKGDETE